MAGYDSRRDITGVPFPCPCHRTVRAPYLEGRFAAASSRQVGMVRAGSSRPLCASVFNHERGRQVPREDKRKHHSPWHVSSPLRPQVGQYNMSGGDVVVVWLWMGLLFSYTTHSRETFVTCN